MPSNTLHTQTIEPTTHHTHAPKDLKKRVSIHLCIPHRPDWTTSISRELRKAKQKVVGDLVECQLSLFVGDDQDFDHLETWLEETRVHNIHRWVCVPRLPAVVLHNLGPIEGVRFLTPQDYQVGKVTDRFLGELFSHLPEQSKPSLMVGRSKALNDLIDRLHSFGKADEAVLLQGESGTGKELCANYLHQLRQRGQIFSVNCADLNPGMIESELFGHKRGAYTGASERRSGLLRQCGEGTCFLDEIGDLHSESQAVLLRFLDNRQIRPVGSDRYEHWAGRIVSATHRDLRADKEKGTFRHDLYFRLSHFTVKLPPLRERMEDIPLLVNHFLKESNKKHQRLVKQPESYDCFFRYDWPGNIRQLQSWVDEAVVTQEQDHLPLQTQTIESRIFAENQAKVENTEEGKATIPFFPGQDNWNDLYHRTRRTFLADTLTRCGGVNQELLDIACSKRSKVYKELKDYNIPTR